jgi:2-keto-4-pentenoate hydratase/2-oxohepta-3-ene-1,7-dioic acid hydratase in catechol pathway
MATLKSLAIAGLLVGGLTYLAWFSSPDPKFNRASFERALTLAQYRAGAGEVVTLLVDTIHEGEISGIDLADLGARRVEDPFAALASVDVDNLTAAFSGPFERHVVALEQLLPTAPPGGRHLGIGTNFPEHAEEAHSESVFVFPKFGTATPARTTVAAPEGGLLDYEVELCMRFDRPIRSLDDFDAAVKGLFLCADFTDRIALLELADPDNLDSGYGFSDAKSGPGFFPSGPFLNDDLAKWRSTPGRPRRRNDP